jgi:hypothetical protein
MEKMKIRIEFEETVVETTDLKKAVKIANLLNPETKITRTRRKKGVKSKSGKRTLMFGSRTEYDEEKNKIKAYILSNKTPNEFTIPDVLKGLYRLRSSTKTNDAKRKYNLIYWVIKNLEKDKLLTINKTGKYWVMEKVSKNGSSPKPIFSQLEEQTILQAIKDKKFTYRKDGAMFGFDRRRSPSVEWVNLLTKISKYVQDNKLAKAKIDMSDMSLNLNPISNWKR